MFAWGSIIAHHLHFVLEYVGQHDLFVGLIVHPPLPLCSLAVAFEFAAQLLVLLSHLLVGGSLL